MVASGSTLWQLLESGGKKAAEKLYEETTKNYEKLYPEEDRKWFAERQAEYFAKNKPAVPTTAV
jgi:hypothetical protein